MDWKMSYHVSRLVPPSAGSTRYLVEDGLGMAQAGRMAGRGLQELPFSWAGREVVTSARASVDSPLLHGLPVCQVCQWYDSPLKNDSESKMRTDGLHSGGLGRGTGRWRVKLSSPASAWESTPSDDLR
jgi:hypothetical protein